MVTGQSRARQLAVILHADVAGSTALVQVNESIAHERIRDAFTCASKVIARYGGRTHELRGDALLAEFRRASDAVTAALAMQAENVARTAGLTDEIQPRLRVGIALGEVVIADNTLTGGGVVLAQRLEQLAEPGGVCIQGSVYESVPSRLPFDYENLGEQALKGFNAPVRAVAVTLRAGETLPQPEVDPPRAVETQPPARQRIAVAVVVSLLFAGGLVAWWQPWLAPSQSADANESGSNTEGRAPLLPDEPSVAVLAFDNMSGDPDQDYFGEGIAEDIITDLSKLHGLFVIARHSSFAYKSRTVSLRDIGRLLGVRYVLEGSVRRTGDTVRINAQLIDTVTGGHLWAERYDGSLKDILSLQDTVTEKVVVALKGKLTPTESAVLREGDTKNPEAFDVFLEGMRHLHEARRVGGRPANEAARAAFETAVSIDPSYARAYSGLAWTYWTYVAFNFGYDRREMFERGFQFARKSVEIGENALAHQLLSKRYLDPDMLQSMRRMWGLSDDHAAAIAEGRKAVALEPSNADAMAELAYILAFSGESEEASELIRNAKRLNPNFPAWYRRVAGIANFLTGDYAQAVSDLKKSDEDDPVAVSSFWLASAWGHLGKLDDAKAALQSLMGASRGSSQFAIARMVPLKRPQDMKRFLEGLDKAGVPEEPRAVN